LTSNSIDYEYDVGKQKEIIIVLLDNYSKFDKIYHFAVNYTSLIKGVITGVTIQDPPSQEFRKGNAEGQNTLRKLSRKIQQSMSP